MSLYLGCMHYTFDHMELWMKTVFGSDVSQARGKLCYMHFLPPRFEINFVTVHLTDSIKFQHMSQTNNELEKKKKTITMRYLTYLRYPNPINIISPLLP